jgi:excinuclease UvrABC helicase subunit UvrB
MKKTKLSEREQIILFNLENKELNYFERLELEKMILTKRVNFDELPPQSVDVMISLSILRSESKEDAIKEMAENLFNAVEDENYEDAAYFRDLLASIQN